MSFLDDLPLREDDRVLLLWVPEPCEIRRLAERVPRGLLVALGKDEEVYRARRDAADLDNVMVVQAPVHDIPWRDDMFSIAVGRGGDFVDAAAREVARVMEPGGGIYLDAAEYTSALRDAGFEAEPPEGQRLTCRLVNKPGPSSPYGRN